MSKTESLMTQIYKHCKAPSMFAPVHRTYIVGWEGPKEYNKNATAVFHLDDNYWEPAHHALPGGTIVDLPVSETVLNRDKEKFRKHKKEGTRIVVSTFSITCSPWNVKKSYMTYEELHAPVYKPMTDEEIDELIPKVYRRYNKYLTPETKRKQKQIRKKQRRKKVEGIKKRIARFFFRPKNVV